MFVPVNWYSELEIEVSLIAQEMKVARPLWITVSPAGGGEIGEEQPANQP